MIIEVFPQITQSLKIIPLIPTQVTRPVHCISTQWKFLQCTAGALSPARTDRRHKVKWIHCVSDSFT